MSPQSSKYLQLPNQHYNLKTVFFSSKIELKLHYTFSLIFLFEKVEPIPLAAHA